MKSHDAMTTAAVLDLLGLQSKTTFTQRVATYAAFAVSGILIGAAAGVLFAPKTGRQLREDLRGGVKGVGDQIATRASRVRDSLTSEKLSTGNGADTITGTG